MKIRLLKDFVDSLTNEQLIKLEELIRLNNGSLNSVIQNLYKLAEKSCMEKGLFD